MSKLPHRVHDPVAPIFLRVDDWDPDSPFSSNFARGEIEAGLSVYDLDENGQPVVPSESEWAEDDLRDRLRGDAPKHVVQGLLAGEGHDGEPLLAEPVVIGEWRATGWLCGPPPCPACA